MGSFPPLTLEPHKIIFYRDDVSEGQLSQVLMHEMDFIRKFCASLEEGDASSSCAYTSTPLYPKYFLSSHAEDFFCLYNGYVL